MSTMYKLPTTFPSDFQVSPKIASYRVASYHNKQEDSQKSVESEETDPRKVLEQKQQQLIEQLKGQTERLNQLLVGFGKANSSAPAPAQKATKPAKATEVQDQKRSPAPEAAGKKDKDAKKEARKAAKAEAVKKVAGGVVGEKSTGKAAGKGSGSSQWKVVDDRKTWETNLTLTVNIPSSLVVYEQEHLKNVTLTVRETDFVWVKSLSKIGEKRGVAFEGEIKNQTKEKKTTVKVVKGAAPSLQIEKTTVTSLSSIWKLLGAALGLFSRRSEQVLSSSHQAIWLEKSEQILLGTGDLSYSTREASQFLARFDSLSSQWEICLADVVFRSLLNLSYAQANNVESWAKKIDSLVN